MVTLNVDVKINHAFFMMVTPPTSKYVMRETKIKGSRLIIK